LAFWNRSNWVLKKLRQRAGHTFRNGLFPQFALAQRNQMREVFGRWAGVSVYGEEKENHEIKADPPRGAGLGCGDFFS
jgi:hypothetical protein